MVTKTTLRTRVNALSAYEGDSIIINTYDQEGTPFVILIDGGPNRAFKELVKKLKPYSKIDLLILTHIDKDHIGGLIKYLKSSHGKKHALGKIILNAPNLLKHGIGTQISSDDGIDFEKLIKTNYSDVEIISEVYSTKNINLNLPLGIEIKILSPNKEALTEFKKQYPAVIFQDQDNTQISSSQIAKAKSFDTSFDILKDDTSHKKKTIKSDFVNASSIAFSIRTQDFHGLFLGDSHPKIVLEGLEKYYHQYPIKFDCVKLSHHGSKYNTSNRLLDYIECYKYIISTNGGVGGTKHPDRHVFAKIVSHPNMQKKKVNFYFNYSLKKIEERIGKLFSSQELKKFNYHYQNCIEI